MFHLATFPEEAIPLEPRVVKSLMCQSLRSKLGMRTNQVLHVTGAKVLLTETKAARHVRVF